MNIDDIHANKGDAGSIHKSRKRCTSSSEERPGTNSTDQTNGKSRQPKPRETVISTGAIIIIQTSDGGYETELIPDK